MADEIRCTSHRDGSGNLVVTAESRAGRGQVGLVDDVVHILGDFNRNPLPIELLPLLTAALQTLGVLPDVQDVITLGTYLATNKPE